jgi:hypothetical protein
LNTDLWDEKIHKLIQIGMSQFSCRMGIVPDATHLKVYLLDDWTYMLIEIYTSQIACSTGNLVDQVLQDIFVAGAYGPVVW